MTFIIFMPILLTSSLLLSGTEIGLIMASPTIVMAIVLRPMGRLSDLVSRNSLIAVGGIMTSLCYFLIPKAANFNHALLLAILIGLFGAVSQPASASLLVEEGNRHGIGLTMGIFHTALNMGFGVGPLVGALLQSTIGIQTVFYVAGFSGIFAVSLFFISRVTANNMNPARHLSELENRVSFHETVKQLPTVG